MKKLLLAILLLSGIVCSNAFTQTLTIPDPNLANWMRNNGYAFAMTGNVIDSAILEQHVTNNGYIGSNALNLSNQGISDLTGLGLILGSWVDFNSTFFSEVNLSHNQITEVPWVDIYDYLGNFVSIDLSYNSIDTLIFSASLPVSLGILDLSYNQISYFDVQTPNGIIDIEQLLLNNNLLTSLPEVNRRASPTGFPQEFGYNVSNNLLTKQPTGNYSWLWCSGNQIDSITNDCVNNPLFWQFFCDDNNITYFNLTETFDFWGGIKLDNNPLTHFDGLPPSSNSLSCINCPLDTWPNFNGTSFTIFDCTNCRLSEIGIIPDHMAALLCSNNPNLACIGGLPNRATFDYDFSNTLIACVPNKVPGCTYSGLPDMASIPECSSSNPNGCIVPTQISGKVYIDNNSNCMFDANESPVVGQKINLLSNGNIIKQYITSVTGNYFFDNLPAATYQVEADTSQRVNITCPNNGSHTAIVGTVLNTGLNFGAECTQVQDILVTSIASSGVVRAGRTTIYHVVVSSDVFGGTCMAGISGQVTVNLPPLVTYHNAVLGALAPTSTTTNTVTWNVSDLGAIDLNYAFRFYGTTATSATLNDTVCIQAQITTTATDVNLSNNQLQVCIPVVGSYDPNNKLVDPAGDIEPIQEWLTYTVNFQNTGNAPALDVYVLDTLPVELDPYSIEVIASSHEHIVQVYQNGVVKFDFPDINLIDSIANEPESHGYVRFKVKTKPNLPIGTTISNRVGIYFDYNPVVMTDYAVNTIAIPLPNVSVYPSTVCTLGDTSMLAASEFSPNYSYEWLRDGNPFNATNDTLIVTDTASYTLKVSYNGEFAATNAYQVALHPVAPVSLTPASNNVCAGSSALALILDPVGGQLSGTGISGNDFDPALAGLGSHTLTYEYTDGNGCSNDASAIITVKDNPTVSLLVASNSVCEDGAAIALTASPSGGTYSGATLAGNSFDPADNFPGTITIDYNYTDGNGCSGSASTDITVYPSPMVTFNMPLDPFCKGSQPIDLTAYASPTGGNYSGTGIAGNNLDVTNTGTFAVEYTYTDGNGCSTTEQVNLVVDECIGIVHVDMLDVMVYPNPASNQLMVKATSGLTGQTVSLLDITGKTVLSVQASSNEATMETQDLANGWYMLAVQDKLGKIIYRSKIGIAK